MEGLQIPLPHSNRGPYKVDFWIDFSNDLNSLINGETIDECDLEALIVKQMVTGTGKLEDLENFRRQQQRQRGLTRINENSEKKDEEMEDDNHRKVSVAVNFEYKWMIASFILIGKRPLYEGSRV